MYDKKWVYFCDKCAVYYIVTVDNEIYVNLE